MSVHGTRSVIKPSAAVEAASAQLTSAHFLVEHRHLMGLATNAAGSVLPLQSPTCRLVVRNQEGASAALDFVVAGLEAGQQVFALAGPAYLKALAQRLTENGLRPDAALRNGRLVFLTAPSFFTSVVTRARLFDRGPLHRNGTVVRWLSDWSWAYSNGTDLKSVRSYQRRVHDVIRSITPLSLCTIDCAKLERSSLLAMLADHRRAARTNDAAL